ncbi:MAG: aminoglycoside phosphotransferase family protein, partial [Candidatus Binataceae bacterium]
AVPSIIDRRVKIIAERLGLDHARVLAWTFAQAVLSAVWSVQGGVDPAPGLAAARATLSLL